MTQANSLLNPVQLQVPFFCSFFFFPTQQLWIDHRGYAANDYNDHLLIITFSHSDEFLDTKQGSCTEENKGSLPLDN